MPFRQPLGSILDVITGISPVDLENGAHSSDIISLKTAGGVLVLLSLAAPAGGADDVTLHFNQCTAVAGTDRKDLDAAHGGQGVTTWYKKFGTQTGVGVWTKVTQTEDEDVVLTGSGAGAALVAVYIDAAQLDVNTLFDCLEVTIADAGSGGAIYGSLLFVPVGLAYPSAPDALPNMIID